MHFCGSARTAETHTLERRFESALEHSVFHTAHSSGRTKGASRIRGKYGDTILISYVRPNPHQRTDRAVATSKGRRVTTGWRAAAEGRPYISHLPMPVGGGIGWHM